MEGGSKKNEQGKWEKQFFAYIPMNVVYQLMDGLFDSYDIYSHPAELTGETFILKKYDGNQEEAKAFRKTVEIVIRDWDDTRTVVGYAEGVASIGILSKDNARNGFMRKLSARARKEALANIGQVFRVDDSYEDTMEEDSVKQEATIATAHTAKSEVAGKSAQDIAKEIFKETAKQSLDAKLQGKEVTKEMVIAALKEIKEEQGIKDGSVEHDILKDLLFAFTTNNKK